MQPVQCGNMTGSEPVETQITEWSATRPRWQQDALRRLATGATFNPNNLEKIADQLVAGQGQPAAATEPVDIPAGAARPATITLESVGDVRNVNALIPGETLTFASEGLTVVYGDNASGKSGYARIIKAVSGALDEEPVHPNVFEIEDDTQHAVIKYTRDDNATTATWPDNVDGDLRTVRFYDEACGNTYISHDSELTYRPSALTLLDNLIEICDQVRAILDTRLAANSADAVKPPTPHEDSDSATFLETLTASTTRKEVDDACALPDDAAEQHNKLAQEEARLRGTEPATERKRLDDHADKAEELSEHIDELARALSDETIEAATETQRTAVDLRAAAELASSGAFADEPVSGVGTETWRAMWDAAREYSQTEAYHDHEFPAVGDDARCVLCHQPLDADASDRLSRFEQFVKDETAQRAADAEKKLKTVKADLNDLAVKPAETAASLVTLKSDNSKLAKKSTAWLDTAEKRRLAALRRVEGEADTKIPPLEKDPLKKLDAYVAKQRTAASEIDTTQFDARLAEITVERVNLEGRMTLAKDKRAIYAEVIRLQKRRALESAKHETDTGAITRQVSEVMKRNVTDQVRAQFQTESEHLSLVRVELQAKGGKKGKFQQRPALLDAETLTPLREVLSEGEQTALGLAGFFTEAHFDDTRSTLVFDDPVTSLDHIRRARVADRIVEFAREQPVIVFTHELSFIVELSRSAREASLDVTERRIERVGGTSPGRVGEKYPWKAKDVDSRLHTLDQKLAKIKKRRSGWSQKKYERSCRDWAGLLSETWERIIHLEIVGRVFDQTKSEVRPTMVKVLSRITEGDNNEFQESYSRCSRWAARHDKSPDLNYVAPEPEELQQELDLVKTWHRRIRRYGN